MKTFKFYLNFASNAIISLFILLGILAAFIGISYFDERTLWSYIVVFLPLLCVLACFSLFYVNIDLKHNLSILIFVSYTTLYLINLYLEPSLSETVFGKDTIVEIVAKENGAKWDHRNKMQVVNDLRKVRDQVYPVFLPHFLRGGMSFVKNVPLEKQTISPLSGISKAHVVMCNEQGKWISFNSDRYGFNNPDSVYDQDSGERVILLGDSFIQGWCVEPENSIAEQLRARGLNVINLASGGNGPLTELALMREYAIPMNAKYILWFYNDTDLMDLRHEIEANYLERYLDDGFSQGLINRQHEVDRFWKQYLLISKNNLDKSENNRDKANLNLVYKKPKEVESKKPTDRLKNKIKSDSFYTIRTEITLHNIRRLFRSTRLTFMDVKPVLNHAKNNADDHGIKIYFIYIPINHRNDMEREEFSFRDKVIPIAQKVGIPVINIDKHFRAEEDYLTFFPYRIGKHYNAKGYSLIADIIKREIFN